MVNVPPDAAITVAPSADSAAADGYVPLFNGRDLKGWKRHPVGKADWSVKDGVLTGSGGTGHLFFVGTAYENFHLKVEAMINDGGNSGVFFRTPFGPADTHGFPTGAYEAQINNTHKSKHKTGSLAVPGKLVVVVQASPVKNDEWFTLEVIADGPQIVVQVNGRVTASYSVDAGPELMDRAGGAPGLRRGDGRPVPRGRDQGTAPRGDSRLQWVHGRGRVRAGERERLGGAASAKPAFSTARSAGRRTTCGCTARGDGEETTGTSPSTCTARTRA